MYVYIKVVAGDWGWREGIDYKGAQTNFGGDGNYLYLDYGDGYVIIYICP